MSLIRAAAAAVLIALTAPLTAHAITLDLDDDVFTLRDGEVNPGDRTRSEGVRMLFTNVVTSGPLIGPAGDNVDGNGIFFSRNPFFNDVVRLRFRFNQDVVITEYDIDFTTAGPARGFVIEEANGPGVSGFNAVGQEGRFGFDPGSIAFFAAGTPYVLTHNVGRLASLGGQFFQIDEFEVESVVAPIPVPATGGLMITALVLGGLAARARART